MANVGFNGASGGQLWQRSPSAIETRPTAATNAAVHPARTSADGQLTPQLLTDLRHAFQANPSYKLAMNAVTQTPVDDVALNREVVTNTDFTFSHWLDDWAVTHQKQSGRCWMFAGLNLLRVGAMKKMKLKEFEFSQNYTLFWDKIERANYFLENIIETAARPVDDRVVAFLLTEPLNDGGQWNMFVNIVRKHGLVPKALMPETESSSSTWRMNSILLHKLREGAKSLRELRARGASLAQTRAAKREILTVIHRILCIHLGTPPTRFPWQWNDKNRKFHRAGEMTPQQFARQYLTLPIDDYVCLVHDPRPTSPFNRTFTVAASRQCRRWRHRALSQRRHRPDEGTHHAQHRQGRAGLDGLRCRQDDAPRPRVCGTRICSITRRCTTRPSAWTRPTASSITRPP